MEENVPESLTVFVLPPQHHVKLRTTNMLEGLNEQINPPLPALGRTEAPRAGKAAKLSCTRVSTERVEPMVEEARKAE